MNGLVGFLVHEVLRLQTIRGRIRLFVFLLVFLPLLLGLTFFSLSLDDRVKQDARHGLDASVRQQSLLMDRWLDERLEDLRFLSRLAYPALPDLPGQGPDQGRGFDPARVRPILDDFLKTHPLVSEVTLTAARSIPPAGPGDERRLADLLEGREHLSEVVEEAGGERTMLLSVPVPDGRGGLAGVVASPLRIGVLGNFLRSAGAGFYLADRTGRDLASLAGSGPEPGGDAVRDKSEPGPGRNLPGSAIVQAALAGREIRSAYPGQDGKSVLGAYRWLRDGRLLLIGEAAEEDILHTYREAMAAFLAAGLLTVVVLTPLLIRMANSIERPLTALAAQAREMKAQHYDMACIEEPARNSTVEIKHLFDSFCDMVLELRHGMAQLERQSITDQLTGLYNRRHLGVAGERLIDVCMRARQCCACLMIDIDRFKQVNDLHGHQTGDLVLRHLSAILGRSVRTSDLLARYGGEEFAIIAPNSCAKGARLLAERIRTAVEKTGLEWQGETIRCSVSIGIAEFSEDMAFGTNPLEDMLAKADQALYRAKAAGRNRTEVFTEEAGLIEEESEAI